MEEALAAVRDLNQRGLDATLNLLGESGGVEGEDRHATRAYMSLLDITRTGKIRSRISIKLTQLGLNISRQLPICRPC